MPAISIIYCYRNKEINRVKNSLDSLMKQTDMDFDVLLVDYGSNNEYQTKIEALCRAYQFCKYLKIDAEGKLWNRAETLNYGIINAAGEYLFTADVDLVFKQSFISTLKKKADAGKASFFAVGYLNESNSINIDVTNLNALTYNKSQDFALGMVLLKKSEFVSVNGYNSFYSIWGIEDTDLKYRLEKLQITTEFVNEVEMLHQYHPPMNSALGNMPEGWIQYLKDYFEQIGKNGNEGRGIKELPSTHTRAKLAELQKPNLAYKKLYGRKLFLRHVLINDIVSLADKNLKYVISYKDLAISKQSRAFGLIKFLNKTFSWFKIPIHAVSDYKNQYITSAEILEEVYFVIKCFEDRIEDYWIKEEKDELKIIIVKK